MDTSKVFSTGQSWQDLMDLANLAAMLPTEPPPMLTDKDYVPKDWGLAMTIAYAGTAGLACLFMLIRSVARAKNANFGVEDGLVIVALLMIVAITVLGCVGAKLFQWGYASHDLTIRSIQYTIRINYAIHFLTAIGSTCLRIVFLLMLRDMYKRSSTQWKWYANIAMGISVVIPVGCSIAFIFQCSKVTAGYKLWERVQTHCNVPALHVPIAVAYLVNDLIVMLVGVKSAMRRWKVLSMEAVGLIPLAAAIARVYFWRPTVYLDWFDIMLATICTQIEMISAFIMACLPSFNLVLESSVSFDAVIPKSKRRSGRSSRTLNKENNEKSRNENRDSRALDHGVLDDDPLADKGHVRVMSKGSTIGSPISPRGPLNGNDEYRGHELEFETIAFDGDAEREKKFQRAIATSTASAPVSISHSPVSPSPLTRHTMHFEKPEYTVTESPLSGWKDNDNNKSQGRLSTIHSVFEGRSRRNSDGSNYSPGANVPGVPKIPQELSMDIHPGPMHVTPAPSHPADNYTLKPTSASLDVDSHSMDRSVSPTSGSMNTAVQNSNHGYGTYPNNSSTPRGYSSGNNNYSNHYATTGRLDTNRPSYPKILPIFQIPDADDDNDSNVSPTASASALVVPQSTTFPRSGSTTSSHYPRRGSMGMTSDRRDSDLNETGTVGSAWRQNARLSTISSFYNRSRQNSSYSLPDEDSVDPMHYVRAKASEERMRKVI